MTYSHASPRQPWFPSCTVLPPTQAVPERPQTRQELDELRSKYRNTLELAAHFFSDRFLQTEFRMIYLATRDLIAEYTATLKSHQQGQDDSWQCGKGWVLCP